MGKASARRKMTVGELNLNLTPLMPVFLALVPCLMLLAAIVDAASMNVATPAISPDPDQLPPQNPDEIPLNLTVDIREGGYTVIAQGMVAGQEGVAPDPKNPSIPVVERSVSCGRFRTTVAPPRTKNADRQKCSESGEGERRFWVYDHKVLHQTLQAIKQLHPDERKLIVAAGPEVDFEPISDVMDIAREKKLPDGTLEILFDEILVSPGQ